MRSVSFNTLKMSFYCLLTSVVSDDKSTILIFSLCLFYLTTFKISHYIRFSTIWLWCAYIWFSLYIVCLGISELFESDDWYLSLFLETFSGIIYSKNFLAYFLRIQIYICIRLLNLVPKVAEALFYKTFFLCFSLGNFYCLHLQFLWFPIPNFFSEIVKYFWCHSSFL